MKTLLEAYNSIYSQEENLRNEIVEFCNEFFFDTEDETEYFVEELFQDEELVVEFFDDILDFSSEFNLNEDTYVTETRASLIKRGLNVAGGLLKKVTPQLRGLPAKTLVKRGYQPGGLQKTGELLGKAYPQALKTQTRAIKQARATRQSTPGPKLDVPDRYLTALQSKRAARGLPSAGNTSAGSVKAETERGFLRDRNAKAALAKKIDQARTVAAAFLKTVRQGAAIDKLRTAARGTKGTGVRIGTTTPIRGLLSPSGSKVASSKSSGGLIGIRNVPDIKAVSRKYGVDVPAPKPAWSNKPGDPWKDTRIIQRSTKAKTQPTTPKTDPKVQKALSGTPERTALPGGTSPGAGRRDYASSGGVKSSDAKMGKDGVKGTQLPGYTPASGRTVNVDATTVSSRRTTSDRMKQVSRDLGKNKGAVAATLTTAAALAAAGSGSDNKKTSKPQDSVGKYNTMDPDGTIRNRKLVGPKIVGPKIVGPKKVGTIAQAFDKAYASAKDEGKKTFEFKGKKYTTESASIKSPQKQLTEMMEAYAAVHEQSMLNTVVDTATSVIKPPVQRRANKKYGPLGGFVAGREVDKIGSDVKSGNYGGALNRAVQGAGKLFNSVDVFDIVKGHLLDEGYADTEEAALVIMANMSEEWKQSIVETIAGGGYTPNPVGNAIRTGAGLLKGVMSNSSVQGAIKTGSEMLKKKVPSGGYSTRPGDGKPYKDGPLWDSGSSGSTSSPRRPKPQVKKEPPMRDEPLW